MNISLKVLFFTIMLSGHVYSAIELYGDKEVEMGFATPGSSKKTTFALKNNSSTDIASNLIANITGNYYSFTGGSYPGTGGDCGSSLAVGESCLISIQFSPAAAGDLDADIVINYDLGTQTAQELKVRIDGHSAAIGSGANCSAITPTISEINSALIETNKSSSIELIGTNFTPLTSVSIVGAEVSNITFQTPEKLTFDILTGPEVKKYDLNVSNECGSVIMSNALDVRDSFWVDMRVAANVTALNPVYDDGEIKQYIVDPSWGMRLMDINKDDWKKGLRFDGYCTTVNKKIDIVVYRSGVDKRAMFGLFSDSTIMNPSAGDNYHHRQYIGLWNYGTRVSTSYGSQRYESGGATWTQLFDPVNTPAGKFIRYHFDHAGQNGYKIEIWEVDSNFQDISLLGTVISNKPQTLATRVCPGVVPFSKDDADYYITGVRIR